MRVFRPITLTGEISRTAVIWLGHYQQVVDLKGEEVGYNCKILAILSHMGCVHKGTTSKTPSQFKYNPLYTQTGYLPYPSTWEIFRISEKASLLFRGLSKIPNQLFRNVNRCNIILFFLYYILML